MLSRSVICGSHFSVRFTTAMLNEFGVLVGIISSIFKVKITVRINIYCLRKGRRLNTTVSHSGDPSTKALHKTVIRISLTENSGTWWSEDFSVLGHIRLVFYAMRIRIMRAHKMPVRRRKHERGLHLDKINVVNAASADVRHVSAHFLALALSLEVAMIARCWSFRSKSARFSISTSRIEWVYCLLSFPQKS